MAAPQASAKCSRAKTAIVAAAEAEEEEEAELAGAHTRLRQAEVKRAGAAVVVKESMKQILSDAVG